MFLIRGFLCNLRSPFSEADLMTKIAKCSCDSYLGNKQAAQFQDSFYGEKMRVFNVTNDNKKMKCSVCAREVGCDGSVDSKRKGK